MATGTIAASEVASACSWWRPRISVSAGTKMMPPPTPKSPEMTPASTPSAAIASALVKRSPA